MRTLYSSVIGMTALAVLIAPSLVSAHGPEQRNQLLAVAAKVQVQKNKPKQQDVQVSFVGKVTAINGVNVTLLATNGSTYTVDLTNAKATRRFNGHMRLNEIQVNDQLAVQGKLMGSTIQARNVQDLSQQARNGDFAGTIQSIGSNSFVLQSANRGLQTVNVNASTTIKLNNSTVALSALTTGMNVRVDGIWNSANNTVTATKISVVVKEERAQLYGTVTSMSGTTLVMTAADNKSYTVDVSKSELIARNYAGKDFTKVKSGDSVQLIGRSMTGSLAVKASLVVDFSL